MLLADLGNWLGVRVCLSCIPSLIAKLKVGKRGPTLTRTVSFCVMLNAEITLRDAQLVTQIIDRRKCFVIIDVHL